MMFSQLISLVKYLTTTVFLVLFFLSNVSLAQVNEASCPGFESQMQLGGTGKLAPGEPRNNVRANPSTSATQVGQITSQGTFQVLDGPVCANGYTWWEVDYSGVEGWTVEGVDSEHWLVPVVQTTTASVASSGGVVKADFPENVPIDLFQGISIMNGGGDGGAATDCHPELSDNRVFAQIFSLQNFERKIVANNSQVDQYGGPTVAICIRDDNTYGTKAISPSGRIFSPAILGSSEQNFGHGDVLWEVFLPFSLTISEPGLWTLEANDYRIYINFIPPTRPTKIMYRDGNGWTSWIGGFLPNEQLIILVANESEWIRDTLAGSEFISKFSFLSTSANSQGEVLDLPFSPEFIVGKSGGYLDIGYRLSGLQANISGSQMQKMLRQLVWGDEHFRLCPGMAPIRLSPGSLGRVIPGMGANNIRRSVDPSFESIGDIPENGVFSVLYGPECNATHNTAYWLVQYGDIVGWTAEGQGDTYWLEPVEGKAD